MRVQARTNAEEVEIIAKAVSEKLNQYRNKKLVKFVIPRNGFSSLSVKGGALYDPEVDRVFIEALKKNLDPEIEVIEVDSDINQLDFARVVVETLQKLLRSTPA